MSFKMESHCGRHDEWLGISIYVLYFHASSVFEHMSNYVLQHVRIYISWWSRRGSFFVHVCGILIDFLWLYEKKKTTVYVRRLVFFLCYKFWQLRLWYTDHAPCAPCCQPTVLHSVSSFHCLSELSSLDRSIRRSARLAQTKSSWTAPVITLWVREKRSSVAS